MNVFSCLQMKQNCNLKKAPGLEDVLSHAFSKHSSKRRGSQVLTKPLFWKVITEELHMDPALSPAELKQLVAEVDTDKDGLVDWHEFVSALTPKLAHVFQEREGVNEWVALTYYHDDGKEYLYWWNRVSGKSTWENPVAKRKSMEAGALKRKSLIALGTIPVGVP
jgi:hypothetical protein